LKIERFFVIWGNRLEPVHSEDSGKLSAHLPKVILDTRILTAILSKDSKDKPIPRGIVRDVNHGLRDY